MKINWNFVFVAGVLAVSGGLTAIFTMAVRGERYEYECQGLAPFVLTNTGDGLVDAQGRHVRVPDNCKRTDLGKQQ